MSQEQPEYFVVTDLWEGNHGKGITLFGHSPAPDTPWPRRAERVELRGPDGTAVQVPIADIEKEVARFHGANPLNRSVLILRSSVQSDSLLGFHVRALPEAARQTSWFKRFTQTIFPSRGVIS